MHNRAGKHGKLHCWMDERGEGERGEKRGLNSYLDVVLICWKRVASEEDGEELQPERRGRNCGRREEAGGCRRSEEEASVNGPERRQERPLASIHSLFPLLITGRT